MQYNIGVDIGGTFTDCVVVDDLGRLTMGKALSTPDDFALGTLNAVREAARGLRIDEWVVGSDAPLLSRLYRRRQYATHALGPQDSTDYDCWICRDDSGDA